MRLAATHCGQLAVTVEVSKKTSCLRHIAVRSGLPTRPGMLKPFLGCAILQGGQACLTVKGSQIFKPALAGERVSEAQPPPIFFLGASAGQASLTALR
jgi:hypothetical protein